MSKVREIYNYFQPKIKIINVLIINQFYFNNRHSQGTPILYRKKM